MAAYSTYTDLELAALLKEGDKTSFEEIYLRYQDLLYAFAYKKLKDQDEAKDILQEVFLNLWNNRNSFELKTNLDSYLYRSVLNKILNLIKHQGIKDGYVESLQGWMVQFAQEADYQIREKDIQTIIELEIAALPEKMRAVFIMRKQQFMSNKEIADQLGISEQTVETHMKKALKTLRVRLGLVIFLAHILP